jgi:two-component system NtrC family sensor kinase
MSPPYRILVVEDSRTQAQQLRELLEREGWEMAWAGSAEPALEQLSAVRPDLIVVDHHLPGMRGDEFCRQLRMNVDTRGIPVLMLTVEESEAAELRGLDSGADDYVAKSADPDILLLRLRALLRKSQAQAPILGAEASFRRARLLAIDDSPTYLAYLAGELRSEDYEVEEATSGHDGLQSLERRAFDCVLVDLVMPVLDGIEVCRRITEMRRSMDNPIVVLMLTAHEGKEDMTRGLEAGADDFVGKSSDMAVLKARIRALLRRKFFQEENRRILEELKNKELEAVRARAETEAAEVRAAMAEQLADSNRRLEEANRKLKEAQMHLIHTEKMASLGQLVAGIAHEMNNPLAFVLNNLFTVQRGLQQVAGELSPGLSGAALEKLEKIRQWSGGMQEGLERMRDLVAGLRTFSRLDRGEFNTVDIHESIESVLLFLRHKLNGRIQVERDYAPDGMLACHPGQLNQVLMNLIANAVDAIEGTGRISIRTRRGGGRFSIAIRDTGRGIPKSIQNRIFEPFFTTKQPGHGVGLGLAISYGIVQNHAGTIEFRSGEGEGTEFVVEVPLGLKGAAAT